MASPKMSLGLDTVDFDNPSSEIQPTPTPTIPGGLQIPEEQLLTRREIGAERQIPFAIHKAKIVDTARDIYTDNQYDLEFGQGMGLGYDAPSDPIAEARLPQPGDPEYAFVEPDYTLVDPEEKPSTPTDTMRSVTNFMFSDEMGILGMKWDQEGFTWNMENFTNQITEHPYSTAFTLGTYLVPGVAAWMKGGRIAGRALKLAEAAGDPAAAAGRGFFGTNLGFRFDDHARLVKSLAGSTAVSDGRKFWNDDLSKQLMNATPEEIRKLAPERALRKQLIGDWHQARYLELQGMAKSGVLDTLPGIKGAAARAKYDLYKKFGNRYMAALNDTGKEHIENLDKWYKTQNFGTLLGVLPSTSQPDAYKWLLGQITDDDLKKAVGDINFAAVEGLRTRWTELFEAGTKEGFLDDTTVALFAKGQGGIETGFHLPAVTKGTASFQDLGLWAEGVAPGKFGQTITRRQFDPAKVLTGPTMKQRSKRTTIQGVMEDLDDLEVDPRKLAVGGYVKDSLIFQIHRGFRDFIASGLRGNQQAAHWLKSHDEYVKLGKRGQAQFVSIEDLNSVAPGLAERVSRMLKIELAKTGEEHLMKGALPAIDRELVEQFFGKGPGTAWGAANALGQFAEIMTGVHKTAMTSLNVPTHMSNLIGNMMFLSMAGMNPFSSQALKDAKVMTRVFRKVAAEHRANPDKLVSDIMTKDKLGNLLGDDRFIKDANGNKLDLAELLSDDLMKDIVEAQSFENVEGFSHLMKLLSHMESLESSGWGQKAVTTVARSIAGVGAAPGIRQTLQHASAAYLGEDMIPKWMYAMNLARQGWGRDSIVREVGRRLPQYRTVGELPNSARRLVLPWITFPAETARILKNNMADSPVSMMAWMQAPDIIQSIAAGAGVGPQFESMAALEKASQPWAVKYQSIMLNESAAPGVLGGVGGAGLGAVAGTVMGGPMGAAIGAGVGAVGGALLGHNFSPAADKDQDRRREYARSWSVDFLPQSSLFLQSLHPHEWEKIDPFSDNPVSGQAFLQAVKDLSPVEPLAVAMPLLELYSGRGSFGREIEAASGISMANKMALGLLGFISPPVMQKYGMKLEGPGGVYRMGDLHEVNGGQMTLPKSTVATWGGLAAAGLTFLGARKGLGVSAGKAAGAAALSFAVGGMAGAEANTRRFMTDLGLMGDPRTGERGDWTLDFVANSFMGLNKSWKVSPAQAEFNESIRTNQYEPMRKIATKNFMDAIRHGSAGSAKAELGAVYKSYLYEWGNAEEANLKTIEWMERHVKMLTKLPMFAGMSEDWIYNRITALRSLGPEKTKMHQQQIVTLLSELRTRNLDKARKTKIVR